MNRTLLVQVAIIGACIVTLAELAANFPFPSPVIRPLLPAKERWPGDQVAAWVVTQRFDPAFVDFFYRDPERVPPAGENPVSPSDGVVLATLHDGGRSELIVGLSFWDVHVVRTPVAGIVKSITPAGRINFGDQSDWPKVNEDIALRGKDAPVQAVITVATDAGDVTIRMITSYWASRLKVWVHAGEKLKKGQRIGRIMLGSTVAAAFPPNIRFSVQPAQRVVAGETIISDNTD